MNNKAVLAFTKDVNKRITYGKWVSDFNTLYFGGVRVAEKSQNGSIKSVKVFTFSLVDCDFNYQMFHAIEKVTDYLTK